VIGVLSARASERVLLCDAAANVANLLESRVGIFREGNARAESSEVDEVAAVERKIGDAFVVDDLANRAGLSGEQRSLGGGGDGFGDLAELESDVDAGLLINLQLKRRHGGGAEAGVFNG